MNDSDFILYMQNQCRTARIFNEIGLCGKGIIYNEFLLYNWWNYE